MQPQLLAYICSEAQAVFVNPGQFCQNIRSCNKPAALDTDFRGLIFENFN